MRSDDVPSGLVPLKGGGLGSRGLVSTGQTIGGFISLATGLMGVSGGPAVHCEVIGARERQLDMVAGRARHHARVQAAMVTSAPSALVAPSRIGIKTND